jgi:4-amino-4-deoxychorismate lyase
VKHQPTQSAESHASNRSVLINGVHSEYLNVMDRSIHYGDGIFGTILCLTSEASAAADTDTEEKGGSSIKLCYWRQHYQRLKQSAEHLQLDCPDEHVLLDDIKQLLRDNMPSQACVIKIILTRGTGDRGYLYPKRQAESRIVLVSAIDADYSSILSGHLLTGELYLCRQPVSINTGLAGLKHLNRLENVIARNEFAAGKGGPYIDGLMLNDDSAVIEGSMSNLFAVSGDLLITPDLQRSGVSGVMRDAIIELARSNEIEVRVRELKSSELLSMDALFITNSLIGMKAASRLLDMDYQQSQMPVRLFEKLQQTLEDHVQVV